MLDYLRSPSRMESMEIERRFATTWNFPHGVGAVDGKHITIQSCGIGSQHYNYSILPITRTPKGPMKMVELTKVRVIRGKL